jgi:hypothetical protein
MVGDALGAVGQGDAPGTIARYIGSVWQGEPAIGISSNVRSIRKGKATRSIVDDVLCQVWRRTGCNRSRRGIDQQTPIERDGARDKNHRKCQYNQPHQFPQRCASRAPIVRPPPQQTTQRAKHRSEEGANQRDGGLADWGDPSRVRGSDARKFQQHHTVKARNGMKREPLSCIAS